MPRSQLCFKIVEQKGCQIRTLFHGVGGSKILTPKRWLKAEEKFVKDGSGSTEYLSGFHVFLDRETAEAYLRDRFTNIQDRVVISCLGRSLRPKPTSLVVMLAAEIRIEPNAS